MMSSLAWLNPDSLRQKLLYWVLLPMVILLALNIGLIYQLGHQSADSRHDRFLDDVGKILLDQLRTNQGQVEFNIHSGALSLLTEDKKDQVFFFLQGWQQDFQFGNANLPMPAGAVSETPIYYQAEYAGQPVRMMVALVSEKDVASGKVLLQVGKTLVLHGERTEEWMWRVLPAQILLVILTGGMLWWGVGRGLRPLLQLRDEVTRRSSLDLSPLPEKEVVAEARPLIRGFNELMGRLDEALIMKRRFVADAAHQLRTPLSGLKAQAELALRLDDPVEIRHSLLQMRHAADHAAHLANQLLLLARTEPGSAKPEGKSKLDLVALARNTTEYWVPRALYKNIDLGFQGTEADCRMSGNSVLLGEMLNNLIDNALRYTPAGGQVTVRIQHEGQALRLEVEDDGPGIPEAERERVFERFYRVLGSNQDGCGLGLAIVREVADFHQADVQLCAGDKGVGTLVRIVFPLAESSVKN